MSENHTFKFSEVQLQELRAIIKAYFLDEHGMKIGDLQANLFIDFLNQKIAKDYYNLGVTDTIQALKDKTEDLLLLIKD